MSLASLKTSNCVPSCAMDVYHRGFTTLCDSVCLAQGDTARPTGVHTFGSREANTARRSDGIGVATADRRRYRGRSDAWFMTRARFVQQPHHADGNEREIWARRRCTPRADIRAREDDDARDPSTGTEPMPARSTCRTGSANRRAPRRSCARLRRPRRPPRP